MRAGGDSPAAADDTLTGRAPWGCASPQERNIPDFIDLVVWGHEHECKEEAEVGGGRKTGSPVPGLGMSDPSRLRLCPGEGGSRFRQAPHQPINGPCCSRWTCFSGIIMYASSLCDRAPFVIDLLCTFTLGLLCSPCSQVL